MALLIPCRPNITHYDMQILLDETVYTLEFRWNTREASWYMSIRTEDELTELEDSIKIVCEFPLVFRSNNSARPTGIFVATDTTQSGLSPGIADLGDRVQLTYIPTAEVSEV